METDHLLPIAKIVGVHGVKGTIKVYSFAESLAIFTTDKPVLISRRKGGAEPFTLSWIKPHGRTVLFCLKEVENRSAAVQLVGRQIVIQRHLLPALDEGTYYWADLIGLAVFNSDGVYLGRLTSIVPTGSNDVYVVRSENNETLIPALASVVTEVNLAAKTMRVHLPAGL